jgi:hypothetical protein
MINPLIPGMIFAMAIAAGGSGASKKEDTPIRKEFDSHIGEYLKLRKSAIQGVTALSPKATPEQIQAHKTALATAIRGARSDAQQGAVFTAEIREYILEVIRSEMGGKHGAPAKAATKQGNPATEGLATPTKVNALYPDNAPLSTVPPTLLLRLPELPKELDYRFVGRNLILRDIGASLIVDYIPNAIP